MKVREPNGPVQVTPVGLLGMLSLKTGGQMPDAMRQDVQPTVEIEPYWLRAKREYDRTNRGITVAAGSYNTYQDYSPNSIIVPETAWWYVHSYSAIGRVSAAGSTISSLTLALAFNRVGTIRYRFLGRQFFDVFQTDARPEALMLAEGFWAPPGSRLGFYVASVGGTGLDMVVAGLDYTELPL
jgi:hypothetical protein